ncbi:MAG TPA: hypothetical protein VI341_13620 [Actinomycetota bacterium]
MPSTIALITGLVYGGVDLQDLSAGHLRIFFEIRAGRPFDTPEVRGDDRTVPYREGQYYGPKRFDRLPILLVGFVAGEGSDEASQRSDTAAARWEMRTLFDPTAGEQVMTCTTEDGTDWTINPYPEALIWDEVPPATTHWGASVRLMAIDPPYWTAGS